MGILSKYVLVGGSIIGIMMTFIAVFLVPLIGMSLSLALFYFGIVIVVASFLFGLFL